MLVEKVKKTIKEHTLIRRGDHIVLGLSGGPDSVCLFYVLNELADQMDLHIHPVHINHMLRPGAADEDQAYVEELCRARRCECEVFTVDCNSLAEERGLTSEEAGREARYEAFYNVAKKIERHIQTGSAVSIAVAQNANDQAETVLQRLMRGTGTDGLSGIAYKRWEKDVPVIRPLLDITRVEIEEYCRDNDIDPVIDHTNNEPIYTRNRIRLEILPHLMEYNENIIEALNRTAHIAAVDKDYLGKMTDEAYDSILIEEGSAIILDRKALADCHEAIRMRLIKKAFTNIGLIQDITRERLVAADEIIEKKQAPKTVEFPHGYRLTVAKGRVIFSRN